MSHTLKQLRAMTDEEIEKVHDGHAKNTAVGINYYLDELSRRSFERAAAASNRAAEAALEEARASRALAKANLWIAGSAFVVAIIAIVVQLATAA
ncbi:hypothetical protein LFM09_40675 [Lentzea alba]|uniref:hypothetical protein n=1 Tax=Lentzea alba TaxID=2714351 RepID=UPI0039BF1137